MISDDELALRFTFQPARAGQSERWDEIWAGALRFAQLLVILCPESPELDDAIKGLEHVVYDANAAVARRLTLPSLIQEQGAQPA